MYTLKLDSMVLYVKDLEKTKQFYEKFFDEVFQTPSPVFGFISFGNCNLSFKQIDSLTPIQCQSEITGGGNEISFFISGEVQFEKRFKEFEHEGARVLSVSEEVWGKTFVVLDPDNHRLRFSLL